MNCLSCGLVTTQAVAVMEDITSPTMDNCQAVVFSASWCWVLMRRVTTPRTTENRRIVRNPVEKLKGSTYSLESGLTDKDKILQLCPVGKMWRSEGA